MKNALNIHVTGIVQGVGFRPFVYRTAKHYLIEGWVKNSDDGVHIFAQGEDDLLDQFCLALANDAPAAAQVDQVVMQETKLEDFTSFTIIQSDKSKSNNTKATLVSADLATCQDCKKELFDKNDKRYRYPFINCTNCGPRFTIIEKLPYDRKQTSMKQFDMCKECSEEYANPEDRRFHAQPDACFDCGPYINWSTDNGKNIKVGSSRVKSDEIIRECVSMIINGKIVAIKGLGGFHLACDGCNADAVKRLRKNKQRSNKAFAIMCNTLNDAKDISYVCKEEADLLTSPASPIVLLKQKKSKVSWTLADEVCMGLPEVGVMLPYTPLQHLILHDFCEAGGHCLVMTSGNINDDPIVISDVEAYQKLGNSADAVLGNNREILTRFDDSVVRVIDAGGQNAIQFIRRARGYAPVPSTLNIENEGFDNTIFAVGPEQKNTFCYLRPNKELAKGNAEAFVSQHIGEVDNADVFEAWNTARKRIFDLFELKNLALSFDEHPEYLTTKWAIKNTDKFKEAVGVQHHHAHIVSVMAENDITSATTGIAFDGTGYGKDGNIWGGEVLLANCKDFERFANFAYMPMPGGSSAISNPLKMAYGALWAFDLLDHPFAKEALKDIEPKEQNNLNTMIESGINCPMTSSVGRIFDAVSALLGICTKATYQGEPAIMLESSLPKKTTEETYHVSVLKNTGTKDSTAHDTSVVIFDCKEMFASILGDMQNGISKHIIANKFHNAIVEAAVVSAQLVENVYGIKTVALSGGVFMNRYIIENCIEQLSKQGYDVAINKNFPCNDGGVSLGQAVVAANIANT